MNNPNFPEPYFTQIHFGSTVTVLLHEMVAPVGSFGRAEPQHAAYEGAFVWGDALGITIRIDPAKGMSGLMFWPWASVWGVQIQELPKEQSDEKPVA